jgi:type II secretory pathway component PulM
MTTSLAFDNSDDGQIPRRATGANAAGFRRAGRGNQVGVTFRTRRKEERMYIGGGILTLIVVILLLIWLF